MPTVRYEIRNEFGLSDPELYREADGDDPEALLEAVAMAGLVGVLRQLGDLADSCLSLQDSIRKIGPCGGPGGNQWDMERVDITTRINKITIYHAGAIDSISFQYQQNGKMSSFPSKGGSGGSPSEINLQDGEFLTSITGHFSKYGSVVIRSLVFTTNMQRYGPYGQESGTPFSLSPPNVEIVGFYGRSGWFLDALGIYAVPVSKGDSTPHIKSIVIRHEQVNPTVLEEPSVCLFLLRKVTQQSFR